MRNRKSSLCNLQKYLSNNWKPSLSGGKTKNKISKVCLATKQPRNYFKSNQPMRATKVLVMVHFDVCVRCLLYK